MEASLKTTAVLLSIIALCVILTLLISKLLSITIVKGKPYGFALELPPYRKPQILKTIVHSLLDETLNVLARAVMVAAPAGAVIWLTANIDIAGASVLSYCTDFLDPFGRLLGLDGVIIMAFILGFPANETVIPIIIMTYSASGTPEQYTSYEQLFSLLSANGWTFATAVCMIIMCILHFPCSTTCLTIKKETGSLKWTAAAMLLPTALGIILCILTSNFILAFL
ncbi:MAG: ferrous iron transporter B [Clostridiales bacterium]|nr:ferrous iron transporter B [Clostridiales bacterium]